MKPKSMMFDGALLNRGFWVYVCEVFTDDHRRVFYVGRTGDSSSANASSVFRRFARHLDESKNAKSNSLYRALIRYRLNPVDCHYRVWAFGPLYSETRTASSHWLVRDNVASLEYALAASLARSHYHVMGHHASRRKLSADQKPVLRAIMRELEREIRFPARSRYGHWPG